MRLTFAIAAACLIATSAQASRSCLNKTEATRTWPTKQLMIDDDGCWTYRRGPRIEEAPASSRAIAPPDLLQWSDIMAAQASIDPVSTPWVDRWPDIVMEQRKPRFVEPDPPLMTTRNVVSVILVVVLICALGEVALGGMTWWKPLKSGRKLLGLDQNVRL